MSPPSSELLLSALVQLLHKLSVRAADGPQKLLKVRYLHLLLGGRVL